ncbi:SPOR domain-containing protein [Neptuniibacter sp. QD72_48]|uniref:SPOR domain-containing protein n=1 Tax=unclassified Neptuniibacter TaxID=2630693 RepID=UPI0039F4D687
MKSNIYFEPPSRLQLLDKLKHLVRFSDFLLLVSGDRGAGKSTLLDQLHPEKGDTTLCSCFIKPEAELSQQKLLESLIGQLPSHNATGTGFADQLKVFHLQLKALSSAGQKCLILIDDAEYLSNEAFELLINLHAAGAQLILMSEPSYAEAVLATDLVKAMEGRVHHVAIEGMSDEEAAEYLQICHPALTTLAEKKKSDLIALSGGMPGRIETLLAGGKITVPPKKKTAFPLPPIHMMGIGIVLIGILGVSLWKFMPEEPAIEQQVAVEERVSVPLVVPASSDKAQSLEVDSLQMGKAVQPEKVLEEITPAHEELSARLKEQEDKLKTVVQPKIAEDVIPSIAKAPSKQTEEINHSPQGGITVKPKALANGKPEIKKVDTAQLEKDLRDVVQTSSETQPSVTPLSLKVESKETKPKLLSVGLSQSEQALMDWPDKGYTLQMLGARSEESALGFIKSQQKPSDFYHFSTIYKGQPWHVVVHGKFANRDIANAAIRKLPKELQNVKPWARSIQGVKIDIKSKK